MKRYYITTILMAFVLVAQAQNPPAPTAPRTSRGADRNAQQQAAAKTGSSELSVRAQLLNEQLTQEVGDARWVRNVLRELDLTKEKNAPLYFPPQEVNGMKNLFSSLFQLLCEAKIKVYKYENESFDDDNILSFKDLLDDFNILYEALPAAGGLPVRYVVNSSDIPSREAKRLFVKEAWYFDQKNSVYDVKTLAICPLVNVILESGEELTSGMFWVKYEDIRPYIKNNYIMTSNINNAKTYTMDDFFRRRMYDGEIIQTENMMNVPIAMLFETEEEIVAEQQRIEAQLKSFNDSLWIASDTAAVVLSKRESRKVSSARGSSTPKEKTSNEPKKVPKQKAPPTEKATKSAPTRSIRR